jgi:hypothetical protein
MSVRRINPRLLYNEKGFWALMTKAEMLFASSVGCHRNVQCLCEGWEAQAGMPACDTYSGHCESACGEMFIAMALDRYWEPNVGDPKKRDVAGVYEVRVNLSRQWTDMVVRPRDFEKLKGSDETPFISVLSFAPKFECMGWILGKDAKRKEWWREGTKGRPPAWWVPAIALLPMRTLPLPDRLLVARTLEEV